MRSHLYIDLWKNYVFAINSIIKNGGGIIQLYSMDFKERGNRNKYSFRMEIVDGDYPVLLGSAVARDLMLVLDGGPAFLENTRGKKIIIRLDPQFVLRINVTDN